VVQYAKFGAWTESFWTELIFGKLELFTAHEKKTFFSKQKKLSFYLFFSCYSESLSLEKQNFREVIKVPVHKVTKFTKSTSAEFHIFTSLDQAYLVYTVYTSALLCLPPVVHISPHSLLDVVQTWKKAAQRRCYNKALSAQQIQAILSPQNTKRKRANED
jgi:hypothetical protein